jgi:uncharacterized membrane protein YecN with MAPEG domain
MTILQGTLLGFALWTLAILAVTVGVYRWQLILTGRAAINEFPADAPTGAGWYRRGTRAHVNCIENLPVYTVIVLAASMRGLTGPLIDALGITFLCARVVQTVTHIAFTETQRTVSVRFTFFSIQLLIMLALIALVFSHG